MPHKLNYLVLLCSLMLPSVIHAQKVMVEGIIIYQISIENTGSKGELPSQTGTYTITFKGNQLRKELKMNNGYDDILLFNNNMNSIYSLKVNGDKKYAIQLSMENFIKRNIKYEHFSFSKTDEDAKTIAGLKAQKATITYNDGTSSVIYYCKEWQPGNKWTLEHFPDIKYLPLSFDYQQPGGIVMHFEASHIENMPVENSLFKIPPDYKIISYTQFQQMDK